MLQSDTLTFEDLDIEAYVIWGMLLLACIIVAILSYPNSKSRFMQAGIFHKVIVLSEIWWYD